MIGRLVAEGLHSSSSVDNRRLVVTEPMTTALILADPMANLPWLSEPVRAWFEAGGGRLGL